MLRIVPAIIAIGAVAFVARYGYVTSDTTIDGIGNAFLFGMIALGAFAGPAVVIAVRDRGRTGWAWALGFLAVLAILANWSHTLGAIAQRGAGMEGEATKAKDNASIDRRELARVSAALDALKYTPTDAAAVEAAKAAVAAAERSRKAECGDGDPKQRAKFCREREDKEDTARAALATATTNKAATDTAAKLNAEAATIRARLANAPAPKETNALGSTLARLMPWLPAASAATFQQGLASLIAELLIAAGLALPELLRRHDAEPKPEEEPEEAAQETEPPHAPSVEYGSVRRFLLVGLKRTKGGKVTRTAVYRRYMRWCDDQQPKATPAPIKEFWAEFVDACNTAKITLREQRGKVYCMDVDLAA